MIVLRDDDANATTNPERLERTYAPLLECGIPINFAVIPRASLNVKDPSGNAEGFLDVVPDGAESCVELTPESPLAAWFRSHEDIAEPLLHGLTHERYRDGTEFGALTGEEAADRIREGREILTRAFGRAPTGFVAPWDTLSRDALVAAVRALDVVSTGWVSPARLPFSAWPAHFMERARKSAVIPVDRGWVLRHAGCRIIGDTPPDAVEGIVNELSRQPRVTVIVLHHWHFWESEDPSPVVEALARSLAGREVVTLSSARRALDE
jgi:hypothetical protein